MVVVLKLGPTCITRNLDIISQSYSNMFYYLCFGIIPCEITVESCEDISVINIFCQKQNRTRVERMPIK